MFGSGLAAGNKVAYADEEGVILGDCPDCLGEVNGTLNACSMDKESCVSTLNDDEAHFAAPWEFNDTTEDAVQKLIDVATGGDYEPLLLDEPFGLSRSEVAGFILKGVAAVVSNGEMPERPKRKRQEASEPFKGVLADRHKTADGGEYVRITLYPSGVEREQIEPVDIIDAEFLFLGGDSIVNVRGVSRVQPEAGSDIGRSGKIGLSYTQGFVVDKNVAKRRLEKLREALRWQLAPVLTDFDPKFNPEVPSVIERVFQPFSERNNFTPSGEPYPVSE